MSGPEDLWSNDIIQFTRFIAEVKMAGLGNGALQLMKKSMDLDTDQICEIMDRAEELFSAMKEGKHPEKVAIRWKMGSENPIGDLKVTNHKFYTNEEMNAFLEGVNSAIEWPEYEQIDDPIPCKECAVIFDEPDLNNGYCEECVQENPECLEDCAAGGPENCTGCMD